MGMLILAISIWAYRLTRSVDAAKLSAPFILFGLVTTLSEGDFLSTEARLLMGSLLTLCILVYARHVTRIGMGLFLLGCFIGALCLAGAVLAINVGNCFLAYVYDPQGTFELYALLVSLAGALGIYLINTLLIDKNARLTLFNETSFYATLFLCFVVLPTIYSRTAVLVNLILWIPIILYCTAYLIRSHPLLSPETPPASSSAA